VHAGAPASAYFPAVHTEQLAEPEALTNLPAAQAVHSMASDTEYLPAAQLEQTLAGAVA